MSYKLVDLSNLYPAFVRSDRFDKAIEQISNPVIRESVRVHGIGDSIQRKDDGTIAYDFEAGNLLESEVQDALQALSDEDYDESFREIGELAEAYVEWANSVEALIDKGFQNIRAIEKLKNASKLVAQAEATALLDLAEASKMIEEATKMLEETTAVLQ